MEEEPHDNTEGREKAGLRRPRYEETVEVEELGGRNPDSSSD
jgi:hypothetical protein